MHQSALDCAILRYSVRICSALFCVILCYTCCWLSSSEIEMQSRWGSSSPVTVRNGPKYPKNFDMEKISQHLAPCEAFLTSIKTSFQTVYTEGQNAKTQLEETQQ